MVKNSRCVGLRTLPPLCAGCLKILGATTSWNPRSPSGPVQGELDLLPINYLLQINCVTYVYGCTSAVSVVLLYKRIESICLTNAIIVTQTVLNNVSSVMFLDVLRSK